jgi:hypothetical protein
VCSSDLGAELCNAVGNGKELNTLHLSKWIVTFTSVDMAIGCQQHPIDQWFSFTDEEIGGMHEEALEWWGRYKELLKNILSFT